MTDLEDPSVTPGMRASRELGFMRGILAASDIAAAIGAMEIATRILTLTDNSFEFANMTLDERRGRQSAGAHHAANDDSKVDVCDRALAEGPD